MKTMKHPHLILLIVGAMALRLAGADNLSIERATLISYPTEPGKTYQLQSTTNVAISNSWGNEGPQINGDGRKANLTAVTSGFTQEFFRLSEQGEPALTPLKKDQINLYLSQTIQAYEIPGIIAGIKIGDYATWITTRGVANLETQEPLGTDYRFRIGSASKTFVAMTILQLIHEKKLQLDEPASKYLTTETTNALSKYDFSQITIRMLLDHTSGIQNYTDNTTQWFVPYIENRTRIWTDLELLKIANETSDPLSTPGAAWNYSNSNYILLGLIVKAITGHTIGDEITSRWIARLQLTNTFYPSPGQSQIPGDKVAHGYMDWQNYLDMTENIPPGYLDVTVYDPSGVGAAGPVLSSCEDLLRWAYAIGHSETLIGDLTRGHIDWRYFRQLTTGGITTSRTYGMGIAHENDTNNTANYFIVGHRGQISGYDTAMQYLPDQDTAIVVVCTRSLKNGPGWPGNANTMALNYIVNLLYPALIRSSQVSSANTAQSLAIGGPGKRTLQGLADQLLKDPTSAARRPMNGALTEYR